MENQPGRLRCRRNIKNPFIYKGDFRIRSSCLSDSESWIYKIKTTFKFKVVFLSGKFNFLLLWYNLIWNILSLIIALWRLFLCLAAGFWFFIFYRQDSFIDSLVPQPNIISTHLNYSVRTVLPHIRSESRRPKKGWRHESCRVSSSPAGNLEDIPGYFLIGNASLAGISSIRLPSNYERLKKIDFLIFCAKIRNSTTIANGFFMGRIACHLIQWCWTVDYEIWPEMRLKRPCKVEKLVLPEWRYDSGVYALDANGNNRWSNSLFGFSESSNIR